ncbi:GNAT family N-acetyltransferase, partial [Microvirga sp. 3-52]|nr:GNAT family N-acetyltransferase [Microvirga sp. 3-52]
GGMINSTAAEVYVFYMDPDYRGLGVGTRLLNFFTKVQKHSYGATEQWVAVAKGNDYGIPFYEARGFIFQHEELAYGTSVDDQDISLKYKRQI